MAPAAKHGEIGRGRKRGDNVTSIERGNYAAYVVARLKRDRPDIAERLTIPAPASAPQVISSAPASGFTNIESGMCAGRSSGLLKHWLGTSSGLT